MMNIADSSNFILTLSGVVLNIILILGFIIRTSRDKTNMENNIRTNTKDISELKTQQSGGYKELLSLIGKSNDLLTELNTNIKLFEDRQLNQGKLLDVHTREIEHLKDQIRAN